MEKGPRRAIRITAVLEEPPPPTDEHAPPHHDNITPIKPARNGKPAGRVPPHDLDAEAALLGACMLKGDAIDQALVAGVTSAAFYRPAHGAIFDVCVELRADDPYGKQPADITTVGNRLAAAGQLEHVGGKTYLVDLTAGTPTIGNAPKYARIVAGQHKLRGLISAAGELAELAYADPDDYEAVEQVALRIVTNTGATQSALVDQVEHDVGDRTLAINIAADVGRRIRTEQANSIARRIVKDEQIAREADLGTIQAVNVAELLDQERAPRTPMFGELLAEGHNATIVARWKVGKSTFVDNAAIAAATGNMFLGRYDTHQPRRVVLFNYELHDDDMADRLHAMAMPTTAQNNIIIVNLRGRRLPIHTPAGRDTAVRILQDAAAELWIVDPFGAAYAAAGGEDENNNAEVRRFLITLDEIKRLSGCSTLLMPVHTGRKTDTDGDEQGRGATVLEDWPDVRMLLTKGKNDHAHHRFLRTEGRAHNLDESRLTYNETTRHLTLPHSDMGISRNKAKARDHANTVVQIIQETPGLNVGDIGKALTDNGITNKGDHAAAINAARQTGIIHYHTINANKCHYPGPVHEDHNPCDGLKNRTKNQ